MRSRADFGVLGSPSAHFVVSIDELALEVLDTIIIDGSAIVVFLVNLPFTLSCSNAVL